MQAEAVRQRGLARWREAAAGFRRVWARQPDNVAAGFDLAGALLVLGETDEAIAVYRRLDRSVARLRVLAQIGRNRPSDITDAELAEMATGAANPAEPVASRVELAYALGAVLDRRGRHDEAFAAWASGARLRRDSLARRPSAAEADEEAALARLRTIFTRDFLRHAEGAGHPTAAPIFVVGLPRSGTSLVEQILASHPKVQGLGEAHVLNPVLTGQYPYRVLAPTAPDHYRRLAEAYLAGMRAKGWKPALRLVDKTLANIWSVGMIRLMFPRAVILHCVRDPADTCFAAFGQAFEVGHELTYDLADLGRQYVRYRKVMDHWADVLPGQVVDIRHEDLVASPEAEIHRLVTEICGLEWNEACLEFHRARRAVHTASAVQVRQPIFTTSVGRWRRYRRHLAPLFEALGPYAPADALS